MGRNAGWSGRRIFGQIVCDTLAPVDNPPRAFVAAWTELWQVAQSLATAVDEPRCVFLPVGLRLESPAHPHAWDYLQTPVNATTFASTGGDGVHFSVLHLTEAAPVVMTVPMAFDTPNQVVGRDLPDFLALGCTTAYFHLERLAYSWGRQQTVAELQAPSPRWSVAGEEAELMRALRKRFHLQPWDDVAGHLEELEQTYLNRIALR